LLSRLNCCKRHSLCNRLSWSIETTIIQEQAMNPAIARRRHAKAAQRHNGNGHSAGGHHSINVGDMERQLSMIGGTALAVYGLLHRSFTGLTLAAIGGALIWRGHTGHCEMYHMLGHSSADNDRQTSNQPQHDTQHNRSSATHYDESHAAGDVV
jgi:hypothetical protein